ARRRARGRAHGADRASGCSRSAGIAPAPQKSRRERGARFGPGSLPHLGVVARVERCRSPKRLLDRLIARLTRPDAVNLLEIGDEDLAVSDLTGLRRADDRL